MSALAGIVSFGGRPAAALCERALAAQRMYGPHRTDQWQDGGVSMGRSLYRLLPEDRFDRQPLTGGGGRWTLVADARLDDRDGVARALGIAAGEARSQCDAALLLAAWERWQDRCFDEVAGDYAFALWDRETRRLVLARDALGGRPLHYHEGLGFVAFASMPKGLHALPGIPYAPDLERNAEFLALMPEAGPRSFFAGISRVEPGHMVVLSREGVAVRRHWEPVRRDPPALRPDACAEALRVELDRAVKARLRGGGARVGAHLSAGIDSSAVASSAALALAASGGAVTAFTAAPRSGFAGPAGSYIVDESAIAAETAALHPNMDHVVVRQDERTVLDDLDRNFFLFDRPLPNADAWHWLNRINDAAKKQPLSVMLSGAMGNMTISYGGLERLGQLAAALRPAAWLREVRALRAAGHMRWRGALAQTLGRWAPSSVWNALHERRDGIRRDLDGYSVLAPQRARDAGFRARGRQLGLDFAYRPRTDPFAARLWVLRRIDFGNMRQGVLAGWGIDLRDPTADRRLVEFCLSLPAEAFLVDGEPRGLARLAFADRVAAPVFAERRRGYQFADWHEGLTRARPEISEEIGRLAEVPGAANMLDLPRMRQLAEDWPTGGWEAPAVEARYRFALLRGVVSGHFLRKASRTNA